MARSEFMPVARGVKGLQERDARRGSAGQGRRVDHQATHCGIGLAGYRKRVGDRQRETQRSQAITDHLQLRSTERGLLAEVQAVDLGIYWCHSWINCYFRQALGLE